MTTRRILIVDDDMDALKLVGMMLESKGYQIIAAATGQQAIQKAVQQKPHLIILDIMMPGMDGYQVTSRLRSLPSTRNIPILVFTGKSQAQDRSDALHAGADEYLTKPIHPAELATRVERLLERPAVSAAPQFQDEEAAPIKPSNAIVFLPIKGGVGNSSLVLNTAVELKRMRPDTSVVVVELQNGGGTIAMQAGVQVRKGIAALALSPAANVINKEAIAAALVQHKSGVDMLLNTPRPRGGEFILSTGYMRAILEQLDMMYDVVLVDVPPRLDEGYATVMQMAQHVFLTLEANKIGMELARGFLHKLETLDLDQDRVNLVVIHRVPAFGNLNKALIEQTLHYDMVGVIPPAPDLAYDSMQTGRPMVSIRDNGVITQQIRRLIQTIPARH